MHVPPNWRKASGHHLRMQIETQASQDGVVWRVYSFGRNRWFRTSMDRNVIFDSINCTSNIVRNATWYIWIIWYICSVSPALGFCTHVFSSHEPQRKRYAKNGLVRDFLKHHSLAIKDQKCFMFSGWSIATIGLSHSRLATSDRRSRYQISHKALWPCA